MSKLKKPSRGSSHYSYFKGTKLITIPFRQPHIKSIYVEQTIELLEGEIFDDNQES